MSARATYIPELENEGIRTLTISALVWWPYVSCRHLSGVPGMALLCLAVLM